MRLTIAFVVVSASTAAVADDRVAPDGASADDKLVGTVLVWHDAALYTEPSDDAPAIHAASMAARRDSVGHAMPMRVVGSAQGTFVEVEPADVDCTASRLATSDDIAKLHFYVKRADLAPVIAKPYTKTYGDGTRVELKPGVPVVATAGGAYAIALRGNAITVELPGAVVAHAYTPERAKAAVALGDRAYDIAERATITLGDKPVALERRRASNVERRGDTTLALFESKCATLAVAVPTKSVHAIDDDGDEGAVVSGGSNVGALEMRDEDYIPAGTLLTTPKGRQVAAVAKPIYLASRPRGKLACVDRRVRVETIGDDAADPKDGDDKIKLCVPASRVVHERYRHAGSGGGATNR